MPRRRMVTLPDRTPETAPLPQKPSPDSYTYDPPSVDITESGWWSTITQLFAMLPGLLNNPDKSFSFELAQAERASSSLPVQKPRTFNSWPDGVRLKDAITSFAQYLWGACVAKWAYIANPAALVTLKNMIGANAVDAIAGDGTTKAPGGLRITYDDMRIYVIAGTTSQEQLALQSNGVREVWTQFNRDTGGLDSKAEGYNEFWGETGVFGNGSLRETPLWGGIYWKPYLTWGNQWFTRIWQEYAIDPKPVFVIGHSAGAAVCEVVGNILSRYNDRNGEMLQQATTPQLQLAQTIRKFAQEGWLGGLVYGQPGVCNYYYWPRLYNASGGVEWFEPGKPLKIDVQHARCTQSIRRVDHPLDPVTRYPFSVGTTVISQMVPIASNKEMGKNTYAVDPVGALGVRANVTSFVMTGSMKDLIPRYKQLLSDYHGIDRYLLHASVKAFDLMGEAPTNWVDFITATRNNAVDNFLAPSFL